MTNDTAMMAQSITRNGSKQAYYTARLMVDRSLTEDFLRAYAYFRWVDDIIDIHTRLHGDRVAFIERQKKLVDGLYKGEQFDDLVREEQIVADLIRPARSNDGGLQSFIRNMLAIIEFDAHRKGRLISQEELHWYTERLGVSVTDGIQYFVGNGYPYPASQNRNKAAIAAHITHLLRDLLKDLADGFINIPREILEEHRLSPMDIHSPLYRRWVRSRVELARKYFREGKRYIDNLDVLRCKIVAHWYCLRFEVVLEKIERDAYILRKDYNERRSLFTWLRIFWLGLAITFGHVVRQVGKTLGLS